MTDDAEIYHALENYIDELLNQEFKKAQSLDLSLKIRIELSAGQLSMLSHALGLYDENILLNELFNDYQETYMSASEALNDRRVKDSKKYRGNALAVFGLERFGGSRHEEVKRRIVRDYKKLADGKYVLGYNKYIPVENSNDRKNDAIKKIRKKYRLSSDVACIKLLQRAGVTELPPRYPKTKI